MPPRKSSTSSKSRLVKVPVQAYLEPEQAEALKALSDRTRIPQQVYLRKGVDFVLRRAAEIERIAEHAHSDLREPSQAQLDAWWPEPEVWNQPRTAKTPSKDERRYRGARANEDKAAVVRREVTRLIAKASTANASELAKLVYPKLKLPAGIKRPSERTLRRWIALLREGK